MQWACYGINNTEENTLRYRPCNSFAGCSLYIALGILQAMNLCFFRHPFDSCGCHVAILADHVGYIFCLPFIPVRRMAGHKIEHRLDAVLLNHVGQFMSQGLFAFLTIGFIGTLAEENVLA